MKTSLHSAAGSLVTTLITVCVLAACFGLVLFAHLGLSAQTMTNTDVGGCRRERLLHSAEANDRRQLQTGACSAADETEFNARGGRSAVAGVSSEYDAMGVECGTVVCSIPEVLSGPTCVATCMETGSHGLGAGYSTTCATCMGEMSSCVVDNCVFGDTSAGGSTACIGGDPAGCLTCTDTRCAPTFYTCTGFAEGLNRTVPSSDPSSSRSSSLRRTLLWLDAIAMASPR